MVSHSLNEQMDALDKRFDNVKMQELKQRKMIETAVAKRYNQRLLAKTFNAFRKFHGAKTLKKKREDLAFNWHFTKLRNLLFRRWKNQARKDSPTIAVLKESHASNLNARKCEYALMLNDFKEKIIEIEQKIALVDQSYDYFTKSLSTSYVQAISLLNTELINLQTGYTSNINSGQQVDSKITRASAKPHRLLRIQTSLNLSRLTKCIYIPHRLNF